MRLNSKKFLTTHAEEDGSVAWVVKTPKKYKEENYRPVRVDANIKFRACYGEPVEFCFNCTKSSQIKKRLAKIDTLIEEIQAFREAFLQGAEDLERLEKLAKKEKNND